MGYTSVERLLPPYPAPPRTESAISYSYSNLSDVQPGLPQHQHSHCSNWPNCPNRYILLIHIQVTEQFIEF